MRIVFYDLETTGLDYYKEDIVQAAILIMDGKKFIKSDVLYFYYPEMKDSSTEALEKHGMSKEWLSQYAGVFRNNCHKLFVYLSGSNVCGHNNQNFDDFFSKLWLNRQWAPPLEFKESFDTMQIAKPIVQRQRISLINLCKYFSITPEQINAQAMEWFGSTGAAHNAYYDVTATALCYFAEQEAIQKLASPNTTSELTLDDVESLSATATVAREFEPSCWWVPITTGWYIPTCSDKETYRSDSQREAPAGAQVYPITLEPTSDKNVYTADDGIFKYTLSITPTENSLYFE